MRLRRIEDLLMTPNATGVQLTGAMLEQNTPNPFTASTRINYVLPQKYGRAKMLFTDMTGRVIKTVPITGSGRGSLGLGATGLSAGVYNYTFYVDEQMVGTKQMILK